MMAVGRRSNSSGLRPCGRTTKSMGVLVCSHPSGADGSIVAVVGPWVLKREKVPATLFPAPLFAAQGWPPNGFRPSPPQFALAGPAADQLAAWIIWTHALRNACENVYGSEGRWMMQANPPQSSQVRPNSSTSRVEPPSPRSRGSFTTTFPSAVKPRMTITCSPLSK